MEKRRLQSFTGRGFAFLLSFAMGISGISYVPAAKMTVEAADGVITINSADELGKIGKDSNYPMNGDYVLGTDRRKQRSSVWSCRRRQGVQRHV